MEHIYLHHEEFFSKLTKDDHCFIGERLRSPTARFIVDTKSPPAPPCMALPCSAATAAASPDIKARKGGHAWRAETYHILKNYTFLPLPCCKPRLPVRRSSEPQISRLLLLWRLHCILLLVNLESCNKKAVQAIVDRAEAEL